jgi:hypothetical protein
MPTDKRTFDIGEGTFKTLGGPDALGCAAAMGHHRLAVNE